MRGTQRTHTALGGMWVLVLAVLTGCGGGAGSSPSAGPASPASEGTASAAITTSATPAPAAATPAAAGAPAVATADGAPSTTSSTTPAPGTPAPLDTVATTSPTAPATAAATTPATAEPIVTAAAPVTVAAPVVAPSPVASTTAGSTPGSVLPRPLAVKPTPEDAARLLAQATFGATSNDLARLTGMTIGDWLNEQYATPRNGSHTDPVKTVIVNLGDYARRGNKYFPHPYSSSQGAFYSSFWKQAATGQDQLRERAAFAFSEIFVISLNDIDVMQYPRGYAQYLDMLGDKAFGNFRDLLEGVALHPMMGQYLSHLGNQKETATTTPDENFAREVMQLFTIGLYRMALDGSIQLGAAGRPVENYTNDDVTGLAKVFTGFSWYHPTKVDNQTFLGADKDVDADWHAMKAYPQFHSTSEKKFLGTTIPAGATPNPAGDLKIALDTLFNHPNVGPFIGRQLIVKLVTSNPSPAYIARVAKAFNDNGSGVRGDLKAVFTAVLTDPEARSATTAQTASFGKLREPIVRVVNWMRAFQVTAVLPDGTTPDPLFSYMSTQTDDDLGQTPLKSLSVFNFFTPDYIAPNSTTAHAGLIAPELGITNTVSVANYANTMQQFLNGRWGLRSTYAAELEAARVPDQLIERLNLLLMSGQMSSVYKAQLRELIESVRLPASGDPNAALLNRVKLSVLTVLMSPQYLVQK